MFLVMPEMNIHDFRYKHYFNNLPYQNKTPDLRGKEYWDVFNIDGMIMQKTLKHAFEKYGKQVDNVAIVVTYVPESKFLNNVLPAIKKKKAKGKLAIIYVGKLYK